MFSESVIIAIIITVGQLATTLPLMYWLINRSSSGVVNIHINKPINVNTNGTAIDEFGQELLSMLNEWITFAKDKFNNKPVARPISTLFKKNVKPSDSDDTGSSELSESESSESESSEYSDDSEYSEDSEYSDDSEYSEDSEYSDDSESTQSDKDSESEWSDASCDDCDSVCDAECECNCHDEIDNTCNIKKDILSSQMTADEFIALIKELTQAVVPPPTTSDSADLTNNNNPTLLA